MASTEPYDVPAGEACAQITEKKSRFIAHLTRVSSEEEAAAYIRDMKRKYWDAKHNCSAFVIGPGQELTRCSDDGEPSGTAGRPMLEVLLDSGLHDTAAVVTRYFGGVLLGTGGLVRAYSQALQAAVDAAGRIRILYGRPYEITSSYTDYGKIENILRTFALAADDVIYGADVRIKVMVPEEIRGKLEKEIIERTNARARITTGDPCRYEQGML